MRRSALFLLGAGLSAALLSACGGGGDAPTRRTIIDSRDETDPRSLDPALSTDVPTGRAVGYLFDALTLFTPDAKVVPGLAERWDVSDDGLTYTFHLRQGVQFHDGTPFTARDVVASWQRVLDPAVRGGRGWPLFPIRGAEEFAAGNAQGVSGLQVRDDSTLVVTLKEPFAIFTKLLAMPVTSIVPAQLPVNFEQRPIGTGPWKFVEWKHDDYLLFARNEQYWGGAPKEDSLRARIIAEPSTAVAEFESGNTDILLVPPAEAKQWEEDGARRGNVQSTASLVMTYVAINTTRGPLRDPRVRQAMNYAVNTQQIIDVLLSGGAQAAAGVIPPSLEGSDADRAPYPHDVQRARQLMQQAGFGSGINVDLWVGSNPLYIRIAETLQANLREAGINVTIVQRESAAAREAARNGQADLFLKDWYADYPDAENFLYPLLHSASLGVGGNVSFFQNPRFDQIVSAARRESDDARRIDLYRQADALAFEQAPMIFLHFAKTTIAVQPWISGFEVPAIPNGQRMTNVTIGNGDDP
jgi:oligopeptide transport system substrate-binding protein